MRRFAAKSASARMPVRLAKSVAPPPPPPPEDGAGATVMLVSAQHGLGVAEYAPALIKRAVVGHGRATKQEVQTRIALLCRLSREPASDAADALALALCHAQLGREPGGGVDLSARTGRRFS